jgi:metal-sulfur cluster biosynthetic enzyme
MDKNKLLNAIRPVIDPELGISIVDLGLIYDFDLNESKDILIVKMTLTSPGCPAGPEIMSSVDQAMRENTNHKNIKVEVVWEPKWDPKTMASDAAKDILGIW